MGSGCGDPIVEKFPSSVGQLPVPSALNAGSPTLFTQYYTGFSSKSKYHSWDFFQKYRFILAEASGKRNLSHS